MDFESIEWVVKLVTLYYAACETAAAAWETTMELWKACAGVWSEKQFVLFEGIPSVAYPLRAVTPWATGSATPAWIVNHTQKEIWTYETLYQYVGETKAHALPLLSMEVVDGTRVHYDLTDYISSLRVRRPVGTRHRDVPTVQQLVAAWSAASQIVLHPSRFTIRVITEMGDTKLYTMNGEEIVEAEHEHHEPVREPEPETKKDD